MAIETSNIFEIASRESDDREHAHENCEVLRAISDALAILDAIGQGGLFEAMPEAEADRRRFQTGISLLDILEQRLRHAVGDPEHLNSDECRCNGRQLCTPRFT